MALFPGFIIDAVVGFVKPLVQGWGFRLYGSTSGYIGAKPKAIAGSVDYVLPSADGSSGYVLSTDGSANLSWIVASGGGGSGTVTSITAGAGLSGGVITTSGTIAINLNNSNAWTAPQSFNSYIEIDISGSGGDGIHIVPANGGGYGYIAAHGDQQSIIIGYWDGTNANVVLAGNVSTSHNTLDDGSGNTTINGTLAANNFSGTSSGTNTGDQDLSGLVPKTTTVNGHALSSNVTVVVADVTGAAPLASPTFTGTPAAPTPLTTDNSTKIATTAYVKAQGYTTNTGTVTTLSVVSTNGFAGTVANASSTPAITLTTSITGVIKGNGTALSTATSGTDYAPGTSGLGTGILKSTTTTGVLSIAVAGDFPTLNQNTSGSAATLTTPRAINGVNFDGSAAITITAAPSGSAGGDLTGTFPNPTVAANAVTYAKFQQVAATSVVGNSTGSLANAAAITLASTATASTVVYRDSNANSIFNNAINNGASTVSAAGTTTLTLASTRVQVLTGSTTQTFKLPDATTLPLYTMFEFDNNSSAVLTINDNGSNTLLNIASGSYVRFVVQSVGSSNGTWDHHYLLAANTSSTTSGLAVGGTIQASNFSGTSTGSNTGDQTSVTGNAGTATALQTGRNINGVLFDGTAAITVPASAGTLTGTTLNATVVTSSLTTVGTIGTGTWQGTLIGSTYGGTGVNNGASTITLGGNLIHSGAFSTTITVTGTTTVTLPTSGTLVNTGVTTLSSLVSISTITTGTWNATKIGLAYGGTNADLSGTGGASQFLKQSSAGATITVAQPAFTDISGTTTVAQLPTNATKRVISVTFDGQGSAITAGKVVYLSNIPYSGTITGVTMLADVSGSAVVDIWKVAYASSPPTISNTITASDLPTLASAQKSNDTALTGWTTTVTAGDTIAFKLNSAATITLLNLTLQVTLS